MDEFEYDEVKGEHGKRNKLSRLNKKIVHPFEMDEILNCFDSDGEDQI